MRSSRRFWLRRAINSSRAFVTAAFFVFSPLTFKARSTSFGSRARLVAMCNSLHIILHNRSWRSQRLLVPDLGLRAEGEELDRLDEACAVLRRLALLREAEVEAVEAVLGVLILD